MSKCYETGQPLPPLRKAGSHFISNQARIRYHNRHKLRGQILYDLFMGYRNERKLAKRLNVFVVMWALAKKWKQEDEAAGRRSHGDLLEAVKKTGLFSDQYE